jgi:hypothetical protein
MPAKMTRPPSGVPEVTVAVRTSLPSYGKAEKMGNIQSSLGTHWRILVNVFLRIIIN